MAKSRTPATGWEQLTWSDLEEWCGERSLERGLNYFRTGRVSNLAKAEDGTLLATVQGTERYATAVSLAGGPETLEGRCTCPIGGCCKHSVAVILAYLDAVEKKRPVPAADPDDRRWAKVEAHEEQCDDEAWEDDDDEDDFDDDLDEVPPAAVSRGPVRRKQPRRAPPADRKERVRGMLAGWSQDRLVDYLLKLAAGHEEVRRELDEQAALQTDDARELIRQTRAEIRRRTAEEAWANHWSGDGNIPDYAGVERRFERLFEAGEYDALMDLGQELNDLGQAQVETSDDEGETEQGISRCMAIVARVVPKSSRPAADRLLYAIRMLEMDEYSLCDSFAHVLDRTWPRNVWSEVADRLLAERPPTTRDGDAFLRHYKRDRHNRWVARALEEAGRGAEVLALLEAEAPITNNYPDLVHRLIDANRPDDARRWALEGIAATKAQWPGIADELHRLMREMAERAKDWPLVAAYDTGPFFEHPSVESWKAMLASAKKAGHEPAVRAAGMFFAETGRRPTGKKGEPVWPLPEVPDPPAKAGTTRRSEGGYAGRQLRAGPSFDFLIELAIHEKRPEDVLRWYDAWAKERSTGYGGAAAYAEPVADAVADRFPERALEVYRRKADQALVHTGDSAYREAARSLRKVKRVLHQLGRAAEWEAYEAELREQYKRRRNFIDILNRLDRDRIVGGRV